jgi:hypothetical protein
MLFWGVKDKDATPYTKVALKDAAAFNKSIRDPTADVYACIISFAGQIEPIPANVVEMPLQYAEYANVGSKDAAKELTKHSQHDLPIKLTNNA